MLCCGDRLNATAVSYLKQGFWGLDGQEKCSMFLSICPPPRPPPQVEIELEGNRTPVLVAPRQGLIHRWSHTVRTSRRVHQDVSIKTCLRPGGGATGLEHQDVPTTRRWSHMVRTSRRAYDPEVEPHGQNIKTCLRPGGGATGSEHQDVPTTRRWSHMVRTSRRVYDPEVEPHG